MLIDGQALCYVSVAPFVGAWIEIQVYAWVGTYVRSLRSSERGLKYHRVDEMEARLKSLRSSERGLKYHHLIAERPLMGSLRSSERGLKYRGYAI